VPPPWTTTFDFGPSLALDESGTTLVVGAPEDDAMGTLSGSVYVYRKGVTGWAFEVELHPGNGSALDRFGRHVAIDPTGTWLCAYGAGPNPPGQPDHGRVYVFQRVANAWAPYAELTPAQPMLGDNFAFDFAASTSLDRVIVGIPGDDDLGLDAGAVAVFESPCLPPEVYCTAKTNTLGCLSQIGSNGTPSASAGGGFHVTAGDVVNQKSGLLFYGVAGRAALPFQGGWFCVHPPARRTPLQSSGGNSSGHDCSGYFDLDFNQWVAVSGDPALAAGGLRVQAQYWSRDPFAIAASGLTDAIDFYLAP
jgi:hypothetical protein